MAVLQLVIEGRLRFFLISGRPPTSALFPYTTLFRSDPEHLLDRRREQPRVGADLGEGVRVVPEALAERSEEHTSELQSPVHIVCRLLLEKKQIHTASRSLVGLSRPETSLRWRCSSWS